MAKDRDVLGLVMKESMMLVGIGIIIGLIVAFSVRGLVQGLLFGLAATDPLTIGAAVLVLVSVSALAGYLPARRAARVDPLVALHYE